MISEADWRRMEARLRMILNELNTEVRNRNWNEPLKPWNDFFERFTVPKRVLQVVSGRVIVNSQIYQANYCFIFGAAFLLYVLYRPSSIFVIGGIMAGFVYTRSPRPLVLNGKRITRRDRYRAFFFLSTIVLVVSGVLASFLSVLASSLSLVLLHACFRHTNIRYKWTEFQNQSLDCW